MLKYLSVVLMAATCLLLACDKETASGFEGFKVPADFPETVYNFEANPVTEAGFQLGKRLFYEPRFSRNNTISCGSCHIQSSGFTQHGHDVSHGIDDRLGQRNSPPIVNLAWSKSFNWDGGIFDLDLFPISPITNPVEMDESVNNVLEKLRAHPDYPGLFKKAFGSEEITTARTMKALSQFMVMLISDKSKYDLVKAGKEQFTQDEEAGYALFKTNCNSCHKEPLFTDFSFRDNGIGIGFNNDTGRAGISLKESDKYLFKVPTLRNLAYTKPYMHDGRILNLETVVQHYASRVQRTPNLDPLLQQHAQPGIPLSMPEQAQLIAFLNTLNDHQFVTNPKFAE